MAFDSDYVIEAMIRHGLVQLPTAQRWEEVKEAVLAAEPTSAQLTGHQIGRFWPAAEQRFTKTAGSTSSAKLERAEIISEVAEEPAVLVKQPANPAGVATAPVQVNVYTSSDSKKGAEAARQGAGSQLGGAGSELSRLPDKSMEAGRLAKAVENVVNSMLKKQVTQLGLAAAVYEIAGPEAKVLFDQATRTILELQKRFYPAELIQIKLGRELGTTFKELVASYERAVDDSGEMPRAGRSSNYP
jgi:hypothetical protein